MTPRRPVDADAITLATAADMLGLSVMQVSGLRRSGLLIRLPGTPSYSRADVQAFIDDPWLSGTQAALVLGVTKARVSQLATADLIPVHRTPSGRRVYRLHQLEVVARARNLKFHDPTR